MEVVRGGLGPVADDDVRSGRSQVGTLGDEVSLRERSLTWEPVDAGEGLLGGEPAAAAEGPLGGWLATAAEGSPGEGLLCRAGDGHIATRSL